MTLTMNCRLCASHNLKHVMSLPQSPGSISHLFREEELNTDAACTIDVWECRDCSFVQHFNLVPDTFYDDYIMTVSHSPQMRTYQETQAADFVRHFRLENKKIVELGCGDGNYLGYLNQRGASVVGVEPSIRFRRVAEKSGYRVFGGYITESSPAQDGPYDGFVTRQVLEHVPNPLDFLRGARASIAADGVGLVEVPSLEQALRHGRFFDFFRDHVNYFTFKTLLNALTTAGFETVRMDRGMNGEFLVAYVRVSELHSAEDLDLARTKLSTEIRDFVDACTKAGQRVAVWGAGGKGLSCMAAAGKQGISYIVDSDPHKIGLLAPITHLRVVPPVNLREEPVDAIILTSLAYKTEIVSELRGPLNFKGKIAVIGRSLEVLEV